MAAHARTATAIAGTVARQQRRHAQAAAKPCIIHCVTAPTAVLVAAVTRQPVTTVALGWSADVAVAAAAVAAAVTASEAVGSAVRQLDVLLSSATVVGVADGHDRGCGTPIDNDSDRGDGGVGGARQDEAAVVVDGELSAGRPTVTLQEVSTVQTALQYASVELSWARTMLGLVAVSGKRRWVRPCVCVSNAVGPNISVASLPLSRTSYVLGCVDEQTRPVCPSQRLSTYWPRCCRPRLPMQ